MKAKPESNEKIDKAREVKINWQKYYSYFKILGLVHKGFPKTHIADQIVMLFGAYKDMMWQREKNPHAKPTIEQITDAYQFLSNLLEQQIEMGVTPVVDLALLKEASERTIYCQGCGRRLTPHMEITRYNKETGRPIYCINYKCHNNRLLSINRHDTEQISYVVEEK